jgi:predicted transcriptional regulator
MMARSKTIISFSIDSLLAKRLEDLADAKGVSRSALVEDFIEQGLGGEEAAVRVAKNPVLMEAMVKLFENRDVFREMMKAVGESVSPQELVKYEQGKTLMNNYAEEYRKSLPPELAAKNAVKKTVRQNKSSRKGGKS